MSSNLRKSGFQFFSTPRFSGDHDPTRELYLSYEEPFIPPYQIGWKRDEMIVITGRSPGKTQATAPVQFKKHSEKRFGRFSRKFFPWFLDQYFPRFIDRVCTTVDYSDLHVACEFRLATLSFTGPEEVMRTYTFIDEHRRLILVDVGPMDPEEFIRTYTSRFPLFEIENSTRKEMPGFTPEMFIGALEKESQKKFGAPIMVDSDHDRFLRAARLMGIEHARHDPVFFMAQTEGKTTIDPLSMLYDSEFRKQLEEKYGKDFIDYCKREFKEP